MISYSEDNISYHSMNKQTNSMPLWESEHMLYKYEQDQCLTMESTDTTQCSTPCTFIAAAINIKRENKITSEDAYFLSHNAIGLADGVGGWNEYGVNSGEFAKELMETCKIQCNQADTDLEPTKILCAAYQNIKCYGSSTAIICTLSHRQISISNLGDSGFLHIKFQNGIPYIIQKSEQQQHDFNVPYQLAKVPTKLQSQRVLDTEISFCMDNPEDADYFIIPSATQGDLIILASDGLLDNLYDHELLHVIQLHYKLGKLSVRELAHSIGMTAYRKSKMQSEVSSPFNDKLEKCSHIVYDGGKEDDICVVVAVIT